MESVETPEQDPVNDEGEAPREVETTLGSEEVVDLDFEYCLARSAILLDAAGDLATDQRDIKKMLMVSAGWLSLSGMLSSNSEGDEDEEDDGLPSSSGKIGFRGGISGTDEG